MSKVNISVYCGFKINYGELCELRWLVPERIQRRFRLNGHNEHDANKNNRLFHLLLEVTQLMLNRV